MTADQITALMPFFVLAGGITLQLLVIAFMRSHRVAAVFTALVFVVALAFVPGAVGVGTVVIHDVVTIDGYALFFFVLFGIAALATILLCYRYWEERTDYHEEFYILLATAVLGACSTAAASHFVTLLISLEVLSISLYAMIAYPQSGRPPLEAAAKYLILSGAATSTMLFGIALIFMASGHMDFAPVGSVAGNDAVYAAVGQGMLLMGIFFKLSLVPFHMWTPDVYQGAPAPVAGFVATASKAAVFAAFMRYTVDAGLLDTESIAFIVVLVGVVSMVIGNLLALLQTNLKRLLAYSSIAHLGYLLIALVVAAELGAASIGVEAALVYIAGYFAMTLAAFGVMSVLSGPEGDLEDLSEYDGLFWERPIIAAVLAAAALSLAGIPLTVGFIAKFYLFAAGAENAQWVLLWALVIGSAIGVYYYLRIVFAMTKRPDTDSTLPTAAPAGLVAVVVLGLAIVVLGIAPAPVVDLVQALGGP